MTQTKVSVLAALKAAGQKQVIVAYSGAGDEGTVTDAQELAEGAPILSAALQQMLDDFAYGLMDEHHYSWDQGEGGGGTITIAVDAGTVHLNGYNNVVSQENFVDRAV